MKCEFISVSGQGFMTFKNPFSFPIVVWGNQTVFIQGENRDEPMAESNGAGKSNLLEAFTFALFGRISKKLRYLDDIINLESDEAKVEVTFILDDSHYIISRTRNRYKPNEIHIYLGNANGEDHTEQIPDSDNSEKQLYIEKLIGLSFLSYSHSIMFCQRFTAFPELKAPQRAAVLSEISGATKYLAAAKLASERATGLSMAITDTTHTIENINKVIAGLNVNDFDASTQEWEKGKESALEELNQELLTLDKQLFSYNAKHARAVKAEKLVIFTMQEKYNDSLTWVAPLPDLIVKRNLQNADCIKTETQINSLKSRIRDKKKELSNIESTQAGFCSHCGQEITAETLTKHIQELTVNLKNMEKDRIALESIYKDEFKLFHETSEKIDKINSLKKELQQLHLDILCKQKDLESLEQRKGEDSIKEKILSVQNQIKTIQNQTNPYIGMKEKQQYEIAVQEALLKKAQEELQQQMEDRQYFVTWAENFPKLRMMLLDNLVSELETEAQLWLSKYCSELSIEIDTERQTQSGSIRDEVNITIITPKGAVPYEGYGGGEIQKIRMAISLALSEIIASKAEREYNLIIFDEPNVGLDRLGKESNIEVFNDLAKTKTVLIIEHDEYFQDRMSETVTVVKENHHSFIQGV